MEVRYKLDELADKTGVSARTIRYYVQRGLLEGPVFKGKDSFYGAGHLLTLRAIRRLQLQFLPLDAIQRVVEQSNADRLERIADGHETVAVSSHPETGAVTTQRTSSRGRAARNSGSSEANVSAEGVTSWIQYAVRPGLVLHLRADADPTVHALAMEMLSAARTR